MRDFKGLKPPPDALKEILGVSIADAMAEAMPKGIHRTPTLVHDGVGGTAMPAVPHIRPAVAALQMGTCKCPFYLAPF